MRGRVAILLAYLAYATVVAAVQPPPSQEVAQTKREVKAFRPSFDNVAGAVGILFGIVGIVAYLEQRRSERAQQDVIKFVQRHLDKSITEETLAKLSDQLKLMRQQTDEEIPKLARRAVLQEQAERLKTVIAE